MGDLSDEARTSTGGATSAVLMALAIMALGAFVTYDSMTGLTGPGYAQVGPGVFPVIVGAGLLLAGIVLLAQALRGQWPVLWTEGDDTPSIQSAGPWRGVLLIAAALALTVVLFAPLGFVAASTLLFACVSAAFGSRRHLLNIAIGVVFSAAIYLVFARGLGLELPAGDLWKAMPWTR